MTQDKPKGKFSYSKLNQYISCPFAYYQKYVKGMFIEQPSLAAEFGSLIHKIEEEITNTLLAGKVVDYDALRDMFVNIDLPKTSPQDRGGGICGAKALKRKYPKEWGAFDPKTGRSYASKAQDYLETGIYRQEHFLKAHPELELVGAEVEFRYVHRGYIFYGFIDRLLRHRDNPLHFVVHDIKTKEKPFPDKELATPLQFVVYATALQHLYGDKVEVECTYDLPILNTQQPGGTKGFLTRGTKKIDTTIDAIEKDIFEPRPSPLCYWCAFSNTNPQQSERGKNLCPYYSLWNPTNKTYNVKLPWLGMDQHDVQVSKLLKIEQEEGPQSAPFTDFHF